MLLGNDGLTATSAERNRLCSIDDGDADTGAGGDAGTGTAVIDQADGGGQGDQGDAGGAGTGDQGADTSKKFTISPEDRQRFKGVPDEYLEAATAPYRALRKEYDPLATKVKDLETKNRQFEESARASREAGARTQTEKQLNDRVDRLMNKLATIPSSDTERTKKIYKELVQLQEEIAEEKFYRLSGKRDAEVTAKNEAEKTTIKLLKEKGLSEDHLEDVYREVDHLELRDPDWFKRTAIDDQIPELVNRVAERVSKIRASAKAVKDASDKNKAAARGVLDEGSRHTNAGGEGEGEQDTEPERMMDQLRNLRKQRIREGNRLFQQLTARPAR